MRGLQISVGMGILCAVAWMASGAAGAGGHGEGHGPGPHGHEGRGASTRQGGVHSDISGILLVSQVLHSESLPGPAAPEMFAGGVASGGPEHPVERHEAAAVGHPFAHAPLRAERVEVPIAQPTAPVAARSDDQGGATAQPNPAATPWSPRPPGAAGPGRPASGRPGPGLPGPGRRNPPRW